MGSSFPQHFGLQHLYFVNNLPAIT